MAKVNIDVIGKDKGATATVKGVTGSVVKAQLAFDALKIGVRAFVDGFKKVQEAVNIASDFNETTSKFNVVFKDVSSSAAKMTKDLEKNFGLSSLAAKRLLSDTGDMLSGFGFASDAALELSGEVQKLAVDLASFTNFSGGAAGASEALTKGLLGEREMMKSLGIAVSEELVKEELLRQGKDKLRGMALKQAKAEATLKLAIEQSKNAIGDYARTSDSYANIGRRLEAVQENIFVSIGKKTIPIFKMAKREMLSASEGFLEFLEAAETMERLEEITAGIVGTFAVLKQIFSDLGEVALKDARQELSLITKSMSRLAGESKGTFDAVDILSGAVKIFSIGLSLTIKFIGGAIRRFIDLGNVLKNVGKLIVAVAQALVNPKKWAEARKQILAVKDSFVDMGRGMVENSKDMINTVIDGFKNFPNEVKQSTIKYRDTFKKANDQVKQDFAKSNQEMVGQNKVLEKELSKPKMSIVEAWRKTWQDLIKEFQSMSPKEQFDFISEQITENGQKWIGIVQEFTGTISDLFKNMNKENLDSIKAAKESQIAEVDDWANSEIERHGVREESKRQILMNEIDDLNDKLSSEQDLEAQNAIRAEITEKQKELKRTKILEEAEKRKEAIRKDAAMKEAAEKRKQFNIDKGFSIANIWLNAASAVMGWWAAFSSMGIPGIVLAGVMSAATLAMAGVQTGIVASQTFHGQEGGLVPTGTTAGDNTLLFANKGEALLRNDDFNNLVDMAKGEKGANTIIIQNMEVIANNPEEFKESMLDVALFEGAR